MKRAVLTVIVMATLASSRGALWAAPANHEPSAESTATPSTAPNAEWNLALSLDLPGKGGWTTCYTFAKTLQSRFLQSGGECHLVIYDWTDRFHSSSRHAFVVYRDAEGRYWGMDNRSAKPSWMAGNNAVEWAAFWDQDKTISRVVEDASGPSLAGGSNSPNAEEVSASGAMAGFSRNTDWLGAAP